MAWVKPTGIKQYKAEGYVVNVQPASMIKALIPDTANSDSPWANQKVREAVEYSKE